MRSGAMGNGIARRIIVVTMVLVLAVGATAAGAAGGGSASTPASAAVKKPKPKAKKPASCKKTPKKKAKSKTRKPAKPKTVVRHAVAAAAKKPVSKTKPKPKKRKATCPKSPVSAKGPAGSGAPVNVKVNFQAQATATPAGYLPDYGLAFDTTRGYGWIDAATGNPASLVGNGRERNVEADKRLDSFLQMQLGAASPGVHTQGAWKLVVPNGSYSVIVAAGDPSFTDSHDVINVEGVKAIDFTPTAAAKHQTNTVAVNVTDGVLNVDAGGGSNTKLNYIDVVTAGGAGAPTAAAPRVTAVSPANGASNVCQDGAVTVQLANGVDPATATAAGLQLLIPGGGQVTGSYSTDAAHTSVTFAPGAALGPNATYLVSTTNALKDAAGNAYQPFTSTFTTGAAKCAAGPNPAPPGPGTAGDKNLASFPGNAGGVDNTGFTTALNAVDASKIAFSNGQLKMTTSNDTNQNHTNALAINVSSTSKFRVQGQLVGPFTAIDMGAEQQGIFWGPDNLSFIKPEVESGFHGGSGTPGRVLTIWMQDNGTGSILTSIKLPGGDASTVDLRLDVDPAPAGGGGAQANVTYSLNGGPFTALGSPIAVPSRWIAASTLAGIIHSNQEGGSSFTATYASFSTSRL